MKIVIETIPISEMRYPTCGDYWIDEDGIMQVRVADTGDEAYNQAIMLHELWESFLITVPIDEIDVFDIEFEKRRQDGDFNEPGDDPKAPYQKEHCSATGIERIFIALKNKKWKEYEEVVNKLS